MKKILLLPLIAVAGLISQATAANCMDGEDNLYCAWSPGQCYKLDDTGGTCDTRKANCISNAWLFKGPSSGVTEGGSGAYCQGATFVDGKTSTPPAPGGEEIVYGCCNWNGEGCYTIINEPSGPTDCQGNSAHTWYGSSACPGTDGTCPGSGGSTGGGGSGDGGGSGGGTGGGSGGGSGGNNNSPIIAGVSMANLTVLAQHGSLHISSMSEASVSLFDMTGKQVFSQKVPSGYSTLNLAGHKQGIYLAVVSSGSSKQTVRVVLK